MTSHTPQIWYCDPLLIAGEDGEIIYADKATVEFQPLAEGEFIGHAIVSDAEGGPPIEINVLSRLDRMDRIPDVRLGLIDGFTLLGTQPDGEAVAWHLNGAAHLYAMARAEIEGVETLRAEMLTIRDAGTGEVLFSGPAEYTKHLPDSAENIESLHLVISSDNTDKPTIEVSDTHHVRKHLIGPILADVLTGMDRHGRNVEWIFGDSASLK